MEGFIIEQSKGDFAAEYLEALFLRGRTPEIPLRPSKG